jgi:hypothetical protein
MTHPSLPDILARLAAIGPDPWVLVPGADSLGRLSVVARGDPEPPLSTSAPFALLRHVALTSAAFADLIAHAPADLAALAARVAELEAENAALRTQNADLCAEAILRGGGEVPPGWDRFPGHTDAEPFFRQIVDYGHHRYCLMVDVREGGSVAWEVTRTHPGGWAHVGRGDEPSRSILKAMAAAEACLTAATEATP